MLAYFLWIPRYRYKLFNATGNKAEYVNNVCVNNCPQNIEIIFENKYSKKYNSKVNGE